MAVFGLVAVWSRASTVAVEPTTLNSEEYGMMAVCAPPVWLPAADACTNAS